MKKFLPKTKNNTSGFTLVELLVVITIIAILSVIGVTVFSGVQKTARDSRRKGDIDAMAKAMEAQYNQTTGSYQPSLLNTYFSTGVIPTDPQGAANAYTTNTITTAGFTFCAKLENSTGNASSASGTAATGGIYYCLKNSQ